jgi:uncharacterized protein GlcG (DUF336 family)
MASAQVTVTYKVDISNYLAGGATLGVNGIRIGGIGVSGGSAEQDEECARAGLKAIGLA